MCNCEKCVPKQACALWIPFILSCDLLRVHPQGQRSVTIEVKSPCETALQSPRHWLTTPLQHKPL